MFFFLALFFCCQSTNVWFNSSIAHCFMHDVMNNISFLRCNRFDRHRLIERILINAREWSRSSISGCLLLSAWFMVDFSIDPFHIDRRRHRLMSNFRFCFVCNGVRTWYASEIISRWLLSQRNRKENELYQLQFQMATVLVSASDSDELEVLVLSNRRSFENIANRFRFSIERKTQFYLISWASTQNDFWQRQLHSAENGIRKETSGAWLMAVFLHVCFHKITFYRTMTTILFLFRVAFEWEINSVCNLLLQTKTKTSIC